MIQNLYTALFITVIFAFVHIAMMAASDSFAMSHGGIFSGVFAAAFVYGLISDHPSK